jgi:hypothetical protein
VAVAVVVELVAQVERLVQVAVVLEHLAMATQAAQVVLILAAVVVAVVELVVLAVLALLFLNIAILEQQLLAVELHKAQPLAAVLRFQQLQRQAYQIQLVGHNGALRIFRS